MLLNKRIKILAVMSTAILIVAIFGYWYLTKEETKYITVQELLKIEEGDAQYDLSNYKNKEIYIKDVPISVDVIKLPKITYPTPIWSKPPNVSYEEVVYYTVVGFKTAWTGLHYAIYLYFFGNKSKEFPVGEEVKFSLPIKEYNMEGYGLTLGKRWMLETTYNEIQISNYRVIVAMKIFKPINYTKEFIENNTKVLVKITNLTDFYPFPMKWNEHVNFEWRDKGEGRMNGILPTNISVYNSQGISIGTFINHYGTGILKPINDDFIKLGDYMTLNYVEELNNTSLSFMYYGYNGDETFLDVYFYEHEEYKPPVWANYTW